jgi:hypothetical protein
LRGNDLVGVNVVAHHIHRPGKNGLHGMNVPFSDLIFNLKIIPAFPITILAALERRIHSAASAG